MAFTLNTTQRAATGHATQDEITYEAPYQILLDSATKGPASIFSYLRSTPSAPWLGREFAYGADSDPAATCREITQPQRAKGHDLLWTFSAKYSTSTNGRSERPDTSGDPTDWPPDWRPEVSITWAQHEKPCESAIYRGGFVHAPPVLFVDGQTYAPQNSAFEIYDPPLMMDFSRATFRCKFWALTYNMAVASALMDTVNRTTVTWATYTKIIGGCGPRTLKCSNVQGSPRRESREYSGSRVWLDYMELDIELQYNRDGWRDSVVDRGMRKIVRPGEDDGYGSTYSLGDLTAGNIAPNRPVTGPDGQPLSGPVLFDGAGNPKQAGDRDPVYIVWQKYGEDFYLANDYLNQFFAAGP